MRRIIIGCLTVLTAVCESQSQEATRTCRAAGTISISVEPDDSSSSATLYYQLEHPEKVSNTQIEVWDRPTLLFQSRASNAKEGKVVWKPKEELASTPLDIWLTVRAPQSRSYSDDPRVLVGSTDPAGVGRAELIPETLILEEGAGTTFIKAAGKGIGEAKTAAILMEEESPNIWIVREYLPATMIDLGHIGFEIPSGYLSKPTRLKLETIGAGIASIVPFGTQAGGGFEDITVYVMSKDRPVFARIEPASVKFQNEDVLVQVLGNGFTNESQVISGFRADIGQDGNALKTLLISDQELQVRVPAYLLQSALEYDEPLKLWIRNNDDQHVSDAQVLTVLPGGQYRPPPPKRPQITSISPYPVPLMTAKSPAGTLLKVYGDNFADGDTVTANNGEPHGTKELKTRFISTQELNVWLPHGLWRDHRLSFRLATQTSHGQCSAEAWQEEGEAW